MRPTIMLALTSASFAALSVSSPAAAQSAPTAPTPDSCASIADEAQRQACVDAAGTVTQDPAQAGETENSNDVIVVIGSRLQRDTFSTPDPVTVIDPNMEAREGKLDTASVLQSSPIAAGSTQITSTISTNFVVNGGEGVQTISLRGLGANRTLVLLNGRRAGPAGVRGGVGAFDLNVIPSQAIRSIDILKTGASSIYGSDAIAGVVNLITKKDLRGLETRGFVSIPEESGGEQYSVSATYGFGIGDRGHFMIGADYYQINELERGDRDYLGCEEENVRNPNGDRVDPIDPRTGERICGLFAANLLAITDLSPYVGGGTNTLGPLVPNASGGFSRRPISYLQFNGPNDRLNEFLQPFNISNPQLNPLQLGVPNGFFGTGPYSALGYGLTNNYDSRLNSDSVIPETKRYTLFAEAGFDLTDNIELFAEGLFNKRTTRTDGSRQLFFNQFTGNTIIPAYGIGLPYFYCDPDIPQCDPYAAGDPLNVGFSGAQLLQPQIYAPFDSSTDVRYYRGVVGARANMGHVLKNGFIDVYFQHSRSDADYSRQIIYRDAIEFGVAELRTDLCAGTVTAIRGVPCMDINYTDPRVLRGDFTAAERAFLFGVDKGNTLYKQNTAEISFGGDLFELPAGPLKAALGGQWRRDMIRDTPGEATLAGNLWGSTTSGITAGFQRSLEAFGEIEVPLLRDRPLFKELTFSGAARVTSTYAERKFDGANDSDKGNWTYKVGGNWALTDFFRLRSTYGTSFRSPALYEQFLANESGFISPTADPCRSLATRLALDQVTQQVYDNCVSQGIALNQVQGSSIESFSGGGVGLLDPETSKAFTVGAVFTPRGWLWGGGGFSLAVDYIDIKVKDQVTQLGGASILNGCYTSEDFPNDPLCSLFTRAPASAANSFDVTSLLDPYINIDTQHNKSIDVTLRFNQNLGRMGTLSLLGQMTYQLKDKFTLFQGITSDTNGEVGDPKWVADFNLTWAMKPFTVTYGLNVIAGTNDLDELFDQGVPINEDNCVNSNGGFALRGGLYCPVYKLPRVAYHSLSVDIAATKDFSFLVGVSNMFNKKPPAVSTVASPISNFGQTALLGSYYDLLGRRFFVTARAKIGGRQSSVKR